MKKKFKLTDLDCANCAAKMEAGIKKIDGVKDATVSFMTQKLTIEADDERFDEIMKEVAAVCKKVEPDCIINMYRSVRRHHDKETENHAGENYRRLSHLHSAVCRFP